jgi:hypothetical protein
MTVETSIKLDNLIDNTFVKDKKKFTVKAYKQVNSLIVVLTDNGSFNFFEKEVDTFIEKLEPIEMATKSNFNLVPPPKTPKEPQPPAPILYQKTRTHQKLEDSINAMIDKVMSDKTAIPQATAICNLTNTMINLEKQQLSLIKAAKSL